MKEILKKLFWPVLQYFEQGDDIYTYKPSHRKILITVGILFLVLASVSLYFLILLNAPGAFIPVLVFFTAALVCIVIGCLGSDRAVAKIWRNR